MHNDLTVSVGILYSFLLVLARVSGVLIFIPLPGVNSMPQPVRAVLILAVTMALFPVWPSIPAAPSLLEYIGWIAIEAAFGLCIGLLVGFLSDAMLVFGQLCSVQEASPCLHDRPQHASLMRRY